MSILTCWFDIPWGYHMPIRRVRRTHFVRVVGTHNYVRRVFRDRLELKEGAKGAGVFTKPQAIEVVNTHENLEYLPIISIPTIRR